MYKILVVEDDERLLEAITDYMKARGMDVYTASDGAKAMRQLDSQVFDLLLLDVMIPEVDGFSLCKKVRGTSMVPVVFITARCSEKDQLYGFELGADDYVTKPFSLPVLTAKCNALIMRNKGADQEHKLTVGALEFHLEQRQLFISGKELELPPKEYDMLLYMAENKNQVLSRDQLLNRIWGYDYYGDSRVVDTHIKKMRRALGPAAAQIKTVIKAGYRLTEEGGGSK
ncbi:MAG: response regulator transcription factor [bacterium]|nr:response regulator transcription factor [bacterium]